VGTLMESVLQRTSAHKCLSRIMIASPGLITALRLGVETPVELRSSSSESGSMILCLFTGLSRFATDFAAPASFNHGSVLAMTTG